VAALGGPGTLAMLCQQATGRDAGSTNDFGLDGPEGEPGRHRTCIMHIRRAG
jgi:hypothetical protein